MLLMATMTTLRSGEDMADLRRRVWEHQEMVGPGYESDDARCAALYAVLDWLEGGVATAPASGEVLAPTEAEVQREAVRAGEEETRRINRSERAWYQAGLVEGLHWSLGQSGIVL